ncbi:MAG TPA: hypothetical protein VMV69_29685 [Pirellulales bacterium]|nr:hypothetical protein [Pirellulales bacterium]
MPPTPSNPPTGCSPISHVTPSFRWMAAPLLFFAAATAGCLGDRQSGSHRLPPEKELQPVYSDEAPQKAVDPRRLSREELEARDGSKAIKDVEENGVKIQE